MATAGTRSGLIVVRVWHQDGALVAKLLATADVDRPVEETVYCSSAEEVCVAVRAFLEAFERGPRA